MNLQGVTFQSLDFWCGLSRLNSYFRDVLQIFDGGMGSRRYHDGQVQALWGASYLIRFNGGVGVHAMSLFFLAFFNIFSSSFGNHKHGSQSERTIHTIIAGRCLPVRNWKTDGVV